MTILVIWLARSPVWSPTNIGPSFFVDKATDQARLCFHQATVMCLPYEKTLQNQREKEKERYSTIDGCAFVGDSKLCHLRAVGDPHSSVRAFPHEQCGYPTDWCMSGTFLRLRPKRASALLKPQQ